MQKKYVVRLSDEERDTLKEVVNKFKGTSQKVRRAQILLKADANGPSWSDKKIADAFSCRTRTVENIRQRFVERGFDGGAKPRRNRSFAGKGLQRANGAEVFSRQRR